MTAARIDSSPSAVTEQLALLVREILFAWDGRDVYFANPNDWPQRANKALAHLGEEIELRRLPAADSGEKS